MKNLLLVAALSLAVPALSACSSDPDPPAQEPADVVDVTVASNTFSPQEVRVKVGQTVRWTWAGGAHNVVSGTNCTDDGNFSSGASQAGGTFEKKFEKAGEFPYFCEPHCTMGMVGTVIVE